ncbi:hypothetical protein D3C72_1569980 [compost metagenome]
MLARDQRGQVVVVLVEQFLELEQDARAAQRRGVGPGGECRMGGGNGVGHVLGGAERHACCDFAGGGVIDIGQTLRCAACLPACDAMADDGLHRAGFCKDVFHFRS